MNSEVISCSQILQLSKDSGSTSFASIIATLIPTSITALVFLLVFVSIRTRYWKIYAPRTFMATIPEKYVSTNRTSVCTDVMYLNDRSALTR